MKRLFVYCEGLTEENFTKEILSKYMLGLGVAVMPIGTGGVSKYSMIKRDLARLCKRDKTAMVTTMLDYYGLPNSIPAEDKSSGDIYQKAQHIEASITKDIGDLDNLYVNIILHEFEGLLFTKTSAFKEIANEKQISELQKISDSFVTPEHINDSYDTAPSRRIKRIVPTYAKVSDGVNVAGNIGIDGIASKCKHFANWIAKLTAWAKEGS